MWLCWQEWCRSITRERKLTGDIDFGGALEATEQIYSVVTDASLRNGDPECDCRTEDQHRALCRVSITVSTGSQDLNIGPKRLD
jgi:hypothetical protein